MPTFANLPLENLLEPRARDSLKKAFFNGDQEDANQRSERRPRHLYISPALYVTPEQAPIPEHSSSDPVSPSPYLANQKRRRGGDEQRRVGAGEVPDLASREEGGDFSLEEVVEENFVDENLVGDDDDDDEGFLDLRGESMSVASEVEANDFGRQIESRSFVSAQGEFFDANDDFSSDGSISNTPCSGSRFESELRATRLSILEEIERRKTAEEALILMRSQWQRISDLMNEAGFTFPAAPVATGNAQLMDNSIEQFSQEVAIARFVAEAIGRGQARAEAEEAAATIIESKDQEIVRLRDRLQYYETVNHEMSQRKLVEVARRQQQRKRRQRRWIWSFMGLSIAIGASFVAYKYIPHSDEYLSSLKSGDATDDSCASPS
ncbi:hypothetical protein CDL12_05047 [Handroanthus impetiginosus]|uniref:Uncharacterized protein n=1 Tax=Handroanthus impetiginosus TaxID=429701 RepID=A0A2G9HXJ0_9LAMI|nr:hypothetical protein CDL12_05047 [Handroanthus impetiginosus]